MQRQHLQKLSREELIREAERAGVPRPRVLTQAELIDEILKRAPAGDRERARARGWLGRARDLLATVVEKGLHLPDAAAAIRGGSKGWPPPPPPLPTVTLAEIYAAQGHLQRAVEVLDEVLRREPDHDEARELRERFLAQLGQGAAPAPPPAPSDQEAAAAPTDEGEASTEPSEAAPETAVKTTAPAGAAPPPTPVSVPPTMPAVEAREQEASSTLGDGEAPPNEPPEGVAAPEDVPESENAVRAPYALATPPSVVTTSRSPSASPPPGEIAPLVVVLANQDVPAPSAEPSSTLDAEPPSPPQDDALADTAPAEPALARAIAAATEAAALEAEAAALEAEAAAPEAEAAAPEAEAAALEAEAAALEAEAAALEAEEAALEAEAAPAAAAPARYDVDEVVAIAVDPSTFYVYWEVRPTTFAHMVAAAPEGSLALRVTAVTPGWDGPIVESRDIRIDALYGDRFVHHVRPRADVRVSVGWLADGKFDPIAVGAEVSAPRAFVAAGAPAPAGAPLDLSEGPHGAGPQMAGPPPAAALAAHVRAADRLAAGLQPRDLHGVPIEEPNGKPVSWVWAAGHAGSSGVVLAFGPIHDEPSPAERGARSGAEGTWWQATHDPQRYGGASEGGAWGGASEGGAWGGASEVSSR